MVLWDLLWRTPVALPSDELVLLVRLPLSFRIDHKKYLKKKLSENATPTVKSQDTSLRCHGTAHGRCSILVCWSTHLFTVKTISELYLSNSDKLNKTKIMSREKKITKYKRHTVLLLNWYVPNSLFLCHLLIRRIMLFERDNGEQWEFSSPLSLIATYRLDSKREDSRSCWGERKQLRETELGNVL